MGMKVKNVRILIGLNHDGYQITSRPGSPQCKNSGLARTSGFFAAAAAVMKRSVLTHCGRVTKISVFNTVKLGTSASSP
jgi:hypothetical protein